MMILKKAYRKHILILVILNLFFFTKIIFANNLIYNIDNVNSSLTFKIKHLKKFTVNGEFKVFNGQAEINNGLISNVIGEIDSQSINTNNKTRDRHLNSKDFLNTKKYPKILFTYLNSNEKNINGILDLHGVTKNVSIPYSIEPTQNNLVISSEFKLNRFDFDIKKHKRMVGKEVTVFLNFLLKPIQD